MSWRLLTAVVVAWSALACRSSGDASCLATQQVDDHKIYTCIELPDLDSDEYDDMQTNCDTMPGSDNYVSSSWGEGLCPRKNVVGGCDLGANRTLWYYPNESGWPATTDMESVCALKGLEVVPPP